MTDKELRDPTVRELDLWIAEHVFGFNWVQLSARKRELRSPEGVHTVLVEGQKITFLGYGKTWLPCYCTDPAAAMQVLEKCAEGRELLVGCEPKADDDQKWSVATWQPDSGDCRSSVAPTLPLAICKFARQLFDK